MRKLTAIFSIVGAVALLVCAVAVASLWLTLGSKQRLVLAYEDVASDADWLEVASERRARKLRISALVGSEADQSAHLEARAEFERALESLQTGIGGDALEVELRRIRDVHRRLATEEGELLGLIRGARDRSALEAKLVDDVLPVREDLDEAVLTLSQRADRLVERARSDSDRTDRIATAVLGGTVAVAFAVIAGMALVLRQTLRRLAQLQRELRHTTEFQQRLMGIVGHDLRSPLTAIALSARLLPRPTEDAERHEKLRERILRNTSRMDQLVGSLMDVTRIQVGLGIPITVSSNDLHVVVSELVEESRLANASRSIEHRQVGDGRGEFDPDRVAQVVSNLLNNALKYSPPASKVCVVTRGLSDALEIEVHNEDHAGQAPPFEAFAKGRGADASRFSVGLGLYVARQLVEAHGGDVQAVSSEEEGTTLRVTLPRRARPSALVAPAGVPAPAH